MVGYETVMVPVTEVPAPQHRRISYYKTQLARFLVDEDQPEFVLVAMPGRKPAAVYKGLRYAVDALGAWGWVEVAMRSGSVYLVRKDREGDR